jgi:hypothetical protein
MSDDVKQSKELTIADVTKGYMDSILIMLMSLQSDTLKIMQNDLYEVTQMGDKVPEQQKAILIEWIATIQEELYMRDNPKESDGNCEHCECGGELPKAEPIDPSKKHLN